MQNLRLMQREKSKKTSLHQTVKMGWLGFGLTCHKTDASILTLSCLGPVGRNRVTRIRRGRTERDVTS